MAERILNNYKVIIHDYYDNDTMQKLVPSNFKKYYAHIIRAKLDHDGKVFEITFKVMDDEKYNVVTLDIDELVNCLKSITTKLTNDYKIVGYKQPDITTILIAYDPYIASMVRKTLVNWPKYEYDDLYQIARMAVVKLYNKKYYIHKTLVKKAFINDLHMLGRKVNKAPVTISLEINVNDEQTLGDLLADDETIEDKVEDTEKLITNELKQMVVDATSPRQYEQLLREYSTKNTTAWSRKLVQSLKNKFKDVPIKEIRIKYYE